jgi:hypothetical protein
MEIFEKLDKWEKKLKEAKLEYPADDIRGFIKELKEDSIILAYGMSDYLLELSGAVNAECGAWEGATVRIMRRKDGTIRIIEFDEVEDYHELNRLQIKRLQSVQAIWCPENEKGETWASWNIVSPDIGGCGKFDIFEDGDLYCRGMIIPVECLEVFSE